MNHTFLQHTIIAVLGRGRQFINIEKFNVKTVFEIYPVMPFSLLLFLTTFSQLIVTLRKKSVDFILI